MEQELKSTNKSNLFKPNYNLTNDFFKKSKVGSCSHIIVKNGVSIAIPYSIKDEKGKSLGSFKTNEVSTSEMKSTYRYDLLLK